MKPPAKTFIPEAERDHRINTKNESAPKSRNWSADGAVSQTASEVGVNDAATVFVEHISNTGVTVGTAKMNPIRNDVSHKSICVGRCVPSQQSPNLRD
jgi:hypothetical protein